MPTSSSATYTTASNQIATSSMASGLSYDAAGNVTFDGTNAYLYDAEGRICASENGSGVMTGYIYDGAGTRVAKASLTSFSCAFATNGYKITSSYVLGAGGEQVTEYAVSGTTSTWVHTNAFAGGKLLASYHDSDTYFALEDWLGTKRVEITPDGLTATFRSLPYGNGLVASGTAVDATEQHFTGKERDSESGNDYFGRRFYASSMGRWLSPDLVNVTEERMMNPSSTLNKYAYGANNPLKYVDPDGQDITIYYEAGNPFPGHTMLLAYNQKTGDSAIRSFGPDHSTANTAETAVGIGVPGTDSFGFENIKSPDDLRSNFASITIQTTPEEAQQVIDAIRAHPDGNYTTYWNNCTTTCSKLLRSIGKTHSHALTPMSFFNELYGEQTGLGTGRSPRSFPNGHDYGRPRVGYDPFQLFFNDIPKLHEEVTHKIIPSVENPSQ